MKSAFALILHPNEIEALQAGKPVTRSFAEPLSSQLPPFTPEALEALKNGRSFTMMGPSMPPPFLGKGDIVPVMSSESRHRKPPEVSPEDIEAMKAGRTVTRISAQGPPPPELSPEQRKKEIERFEAEHAKLLRVKIVEYQLQGNDHVYTFEAAKTGEQGM